MELISNFKIKALLIFCFLILQAKSISENEMEEIITKIFESQEMKSMKSQLEICTRDRQEMVTVIQDNVAQIKSLMQAGGMYRMYARGCTCLAASKKPHFPAPPILNIFNGLVLGLVELIDAKGIGLSQLLWL